MSRTFVRFLATLPFLVSFAVGKSPSAKYRLHYLTPDAINVVQLLPDPPVDNSPEHREELELLLKLQQGRTPAEVARAQAEEDHFTAFSFADVLGPEFKEENCPKTAAFFKTALEDDLQYFNKLAKAHWSRPRPASDLRIHALFSDNDGSYPSGHSIRATLYAEFLATFVPQQRHALIARSQQIGWDREIAGMHFPSDIFAGRVLGKALAHALLAKPEIQSQLAPLRAEIEQALKSPATVTAPE